MRLSVGWFHPMGVKCAPKAVPIVFPINAYTVYTPNRPRQFVNTRRLCALDHTRNECGINDCMLDKVSFEFMLAHFVLGKTKIPHTHATEPKIHMQMNSLFALLEKLYKKKCHFKLWNNLLQFFVFLAPYFTIILARTLYFSFHVHFFSFANAITLWLLDEKKAGIETRMKHEREGLLERKCVKWSSISAFLISHCVLWSKNCEFNGYFACVQSTLRQQYWGTHYAHMWTKQINTRTHM